MTSPFATGGGGTQLEARVVAAFLTAAFAEAPSRGLPGGYVETVLTQRAAFGQPLDDLVITARMSDGGIGTLHLQVKNELSFTEKDINWTTALAQAWNTFRNGFDETHDRVGVAIGVFNAKADKHYQAVLNWATQSPDGNNFISRISKPDFSHKDRAAFVETVREILAVHSGQPIDNETLWRFLRRFVILHFDIGVDAGSRDLEAVHDRIRGYLPDGDRDRASDLWAHFVKVAGEMTPAGGGATRATLLDGLRADSLPTGLPGRFRADLEIVAKASDRALASVKDNIHGLRLHRLVAYRKIKSALEEGRFIQITGEPGVGKSALLKEIAEEAGRTGPVLVLKDSRIAARGWSAQAAEFGTTSDLAALLREIGVAGNSVLFVDGIDKITDPAVQLTVNDIITTIATEPSLSEWKVLATVREQNLQHIGTWLNPTAIAKLPVRTVAVPMLERSELEVVAKAHPRLKHLLLESGGVDVILRRPFFLDEVLTLAGRTGDAELPASEVELLSLWWTLGAAERADFTPAQQRRNALLSLAERLSTKPESPIAIRDMDAQPLEDLKSAGVVRDHRLGHSVVFAHDIYEEWALTELLISETDRTSETLLRLGEPQSLVRPVQLLGSFLLETSSDEVDWRGLYEDLAAQTLRPVWQRAVLTSCLRSTRATEILGRLSDYLHADDDACLKRLLSALGTLEVIPNTLFLEEAITPGLSPDERVKLAHLSALPKDMTWVRFLDWYLPHVGDPPPALIPDLIPIFSTWQSAHGGQDVRHCRRMGEIASGWLAEFEAAGHPESFRNHREPFGLKFDRNDERDLEASLRALFLASAADVPDLVTNYLAEKAVAKGRHMFRDGIIKNIWTPARFVPAAVVDYILSAFLKHPKDATDRRGSHSRMLPDDLGLVGDGAFYPASPLQGPFLILLRQHEAEGLRLIRSLCNHCIEVWRWVHSGDGDGRTLTPIPVKATFDWGEQTFWGDGQVYLWFRAVWGNDAVKSGLMALEQWALERIDAGDDFDNVFRKVLQGNDSVAALGLATSLALAHQDKSIACALPLVTSTHVWNWDLSRAADEQGGMWSNEIANWLSHRHLMDGVRALNCRPHRGQSVRELVPYYVLWHDQALKERYVNGIRNFAENLPLVYEEEKEDAEHIESVRNQMAWFAEQADPQYWKVERTEDGAIKVWNDPPSANAPERVQIREEHTLLNRCMALVNWAQRSLEKGVLDQRFSIGAAEAEARDLDQESLYDTPFDVEEFVEAQRKSGVAAAAFVIARHATTDDWTKETADWCFEILQRASGMPALLDGLTVRQSTISMHPLVYAAEGLSALLARGHETRVCQGLLLEFAIDPLEELIRTLAKASSQYAARYPEFYWILFRLLVVRCIFDKDDGPDFHTPAWSEPEAVRLLALLAEAETALDAGTTPTLPQIPMPWIARPDLVDDEEGYAPWKGWGRNPSVFHWNIAERAIFPVQLDVVLAHPERRHQFVDLLGQLVAFTIQSSRAPWARSRHDDDGNKPYRWIHSAFSWFGRIACHLSPNEVRMQILDPILAADDDTALNGMDGFMLSFMIDGLLPPGAVTDERLEIWTIATEWALAHDEGRYAEGRYLDRHFTGCAASVLFCASGDFRPFVCGIEEGWVPLPRFQDTIERAVRRFGLNSLLFVLVLRFFKSGGMDLLPDPGLGWLLEIAQARKAQKPFWDENGDETVDLLKTILEKTAACLTPAARATIALICDILVDNGVRGAAFLQQEQLRQDAR